MTSPISDIETIIDRHPSIQEVDDFWAEAAKRVDWFKPWDKVCNRDVLERGRWFEGAHCNTCFNTLDRHVMAGNGDKIAMIYESPITDSEPVSISYADMLAQVKQIAGMLHEVGVKKGDRVIIYMPMIPESVMAMLACARLGAVHSVVFGGFAADELAKRIEHAKASVVMTASCGLEPSRVINYKTILDRAIDSISHTVQHCFILQRPQLHVNLNDGRDYDWKRSQATAKPFEDVIHLLATDPLYILYTSGTTGSPKGVVRENGGHMVALLWSMTEIYGVKAGDVFWAASDIGWVVGHSYIVYAPLLLGCTSILFEGKPVGTPDAGVFWRIIARHRVRVLFTAPTALRAIIRVDSDGAWIQRFDLSSLRALFLAGERSDPKTISWAEQQLEVPVIDHWWQTETGWTICGNKMTQSGVLSWPVRHGSAGKPMPGYDLVVLDDNGKSLDQNQLGALCIALPLPPGCFNTLWEAHDVYLEKYTERYPGYYETGDAGYRDLDGFIYVMARTDDIINVSGHRLSTGRMEEVVAHHPAVAECGVFGIDDAIKGQMPCCLFVMKNNSNQDPVSVEQDIKALVRDEIGAIASFAITVCVQRLPKTRSGKILRATLSKMISNQPWVMPATVDDPFVFDEINQSIQKQCLSQDNKTHKR